MKIDEIFFKNEEVTNRRDGMGHDPDHTLAKLKDAIRDGQTPTIQNAGGVRGGWAWGDLQKLGWAQRHREPGMGGTSREWWEYTGPNQINLVTGGNPGRKQVMQAGDTTDPIEIDYS